MEDKELTKTLSKKEIDFCDLYVFGTDPYTGNARKCYSEIFKMGERMALKEATALMERKDVSDYIAHLQQLKNHETRNLKDRLTEKLLRIVEETSTAVYTDRRGTVLSPAPLRSVAVQATKALMDMHPLKVAQENKLELSGNDGAGITFNVIVPEPKDKVGME